MNTAITQQSTALRVRCLHIEPHIYEALAQELVEKIGDRDYLPTTMLEIEDADGVLFRFSVAAIIYRGAEYQPEGKRRPITNVAPIWWKLHSFRGEQEVLNDAIFYRIKELIIN